MGEQRKQGHKRFYKHLPPVRSILERNALVLQYSGLPLAVARKMVIHFLSIADAANAGVIGLIRAAEMWRAEMGKFSTYAWNWIKRSIQDADALAAPIHVPRAYLDRRVTAVRYDADARRALATKSYSGMVSGNDGDNNNNNNDPWEYALRDRRYDDEGKNNDDRLDTIRLLIPALLTPREQEVLRLCHEEGLTKRQAGARLGKSHEWVRLSYLSSIRKIRCALKCRGLMSE